MDEDAIWAFQRIVAPVLGAVVMANACGILPTFVTVMLTTSEMLNLRVGPGEVKFVAEVPKP